MNKQWIEENGSYVLLIKPYRKKLKVAEIFKLVNKEPWFYSSKLIRVDCDILKSNDINEAKQEIENMIINYYKGKCNYYQKLVDQFSRKEE